ncbi:MAG: sce7726 family protein [Butyrivibrio sp.]|nr:sce7726 family protein [Butyrivibrio sp.]
MTAHDRHIREPLFDYLEDRYGKIRIIEEKRTGRARADVVMVTPDAIYGIEIKSDNDTYTRLAGQVKNYNIYYDYNIVAVGSSHAAHIEEHVPKWWGIITIEDVDGKLDFYTLREAGPSPMVKDERKISILWRLELANIQAINGLPKYKEKSKAFVQKKILEKVPSSLLWRQVSEELFQRDYTLISDEIEAYRKENHR